MILVGMMILSENPHHDVPRDGLKLRSESGFGRVSTGLLIG